MSETKPSPPVIDDLTGVMRRAAATLDMLHGPRGGGDPAQIGPYRVLERLGEGGMGVVYLAEQREPVRRMVALKLIRGGMATPETLARFEAERQALAMLSHPHIARVFHAGVTEAGSPYFAMEHIAGVPLTQYCDDHRLTVRRRLELFVLVCHGVQHAHQKGIIHRDLKPGNILVTEVDGRAVPKVIDFGTVKSDHPLTVRTLYTRTGAVMGTPQYMAPEQAGTDELDVDTRADVYALGVVLYELLTGALPVSADAVRGAAPERLARILRENEPARPSTRVTARSRFGGVRTGGGGGGEAVAWEAAARRGADPRGLARQIRGDLDCITLKAMEKDRARRYETVDALAQDVRRHLEDEPIVARPPGRADRARKFARRHAAALWTTGVVVAALVAGLALATAGFVRAREERDAARASAAHAEVVSRFLRETLATMPETARGPTVSVRGLLDAAAERVERGAFKGVPQAEAAVRATLGRAYAALHLNGAAEPQFRAALEVQERLHGGRDGADVARALRELADVLPQRSESDAAEALARRALAISGRLWPDGAREVADAKSTLAAVLVAKGDYAAAEPLYADALQTLRGLLGDHPDVAAALSNLADVRRLGNGGPAAAEPLHREALDMFRRHLGDDHPSVGEAYRNLADALEDRGDLGGAEAAQRQALAIFRGALGDGNETVLRTTVGLAELLTARREYRAAAEVLLERHRGLAARGGAAAAEDVVLSRQIAVVYRTWGDPAEAGVWTTRARSVQRQALLKELEQRSREVGQRPDDGAALAARAKLRARAGLFAEAAADYDRAMGLGVSDHWAWYVRAALLAYVDRGDAYGAHCREMLARFSAVTGRPAVRVAKASLLMPAAGVDLGALNRAALAARERDVHPRDVAWDEMAIGMGEHRLGRSERAVEHLGQSLRTMQSVPGRAAAEFYLAVNLLRSGRDAAARDALARAEGLMAELPGVGEGDLGESGIENWLIAHVARREAAGEMGAGGDNP